MQIKISPEDKLMSQYVRLRDMKCMRCHSQVQLNSKGLPITHQNSHYYGRRKEATRFDTENCDTLCMGCHMRWGSDEKEEYRNFKIKQLGQKGFDLLTLRANGYFKKDRKLAYLQAKALLESIL